MNIHNINIDYEPCDADGVQLASIPCQIEFEYTPAGGDGWNEPRYDACVEFVSVTYKYIGFGWPGEDESVKDRIEQWAAEWVEGAGRDECIRIVGDEIDDARERAAEARAEAQRDRT